MKDQEFGIYWEPFISLDGEIKNGELHLISCVLGDDYDSEKHYFFSRESTEKLFSIISLERFIQLCRSRHLSGLEAFLKRKGIKYQTHII